ncbi:glycosyltransferase [Lutibacter sp. A80]|uniref:glycosyltransferase n=1 Tax=Lutibacter sp. A80 TaxID=2918453 RepID=UPI001F0595EE|nr:glycosyltransferase [Lutibacter sp. A80]UMB60335.1 glycosyltransferase [Lutibacter sp. A80]
MNKYLSVIVPVYNVEDYLHKCIDSIINQTFHHLEIILVNDGSTDTSAQICDNYAKKDTRIKVIHQSNAGVSVARNKGIEIAMGEYITFIDSDDFIEEDFIETLYTTSKKNNLDIVISNFHKEQEEIINERKSNFSTTKVFDRLEIQEKIIPFFLKEDGLNSCCNKIYKADLIKNNAINFPIGITNGEDALFNLQCFNKATKVQFINYAGYYYREVTGSATRNILNKDYFKIALDVYNFKHVKAYKLTLSEIEATKLKSIRFVTTIVSLIHIYLQSNAEIPFKQRFLYVKNMISNKQVQDVLHKNWTELKINKGNYQKLLLYCMKIKSMAGLFILTAYSNIRNKS